jgi:hypothetical protein
MRVTPFVVAVGLVVVPACGGKKERGTSSATTAGSNTGSAVNESAPVPQVKKPVDTKPLPPLAADPGGATGKPVWAAAFGGLGIDAPRGIAIGADGAAYVGGYFDTDIDFGGTIGKRTVESEDAKTKRADAYLAKLTPDGKLAWVQTFGAKRDDVINSVAMRGDTVVVAGNFLDTVKVGGLEKKSIGSDDAIIAAFDTSGNVKWVWNFGGIDSDGANSIAATPDGGWVFGGSFSDTANFGATTFTSRGAVDAMLVKLDGEGKLEWVKQFGGAYADTIQYVAVDGQGNIVVQGVFKDVSDWGGPNKLKAGGGSDNDVVLAKYDLNGDHLWSQRFGNAFNDVAGGVAIDPSGHITMVGSFDRSVSFGEGDEHTAVGEADAFVARFTPDGKLEWAHTYGASREDIAMGVAVDAAGNSVTTGWFQDTVDFGGTSLTSKGNKDVFALKLDAKGDLIWAERFGSKDHDQGRAIALDDKGAAYVTGIYRFKLDGAPNPPESVRASGDRIPKPDTFVLELDR